MEQKIGFCTASDGVRIAYATVGQGPPLVKAPNWLTHLEFEWQSPVWCHWWEELAKEHTVIRFDQRGSGLSDWAVPDMSFETWISDLEAVVEQLGLEHFAMLGISQGGAVAVRYITAHPERVDRLILYGAYARGRRRRGDSMEEEEAMETLMRLGWGRDNPAYRQLFTSQFMPGASAEQMRWFNELQRVSTSPENAVRIRRETNDIDVLNLLPQISVPTLVLHARSDCRVPFEQGRQLAALIPNARLVPLDSENHLLIAAEPAWQTVLTEVRQFLGVQGEAADDGPVQEVHIEYPDGLSHREVEVLRLVATGMTNQEIADRLFISVGTVSTHVKNLLNKTNCANRTEAAAYASRCFLLDE